MCFCLFPVYGVDCNVFCAYLVSTCGKFCGVDCVLFPGGFFVYLFGIFIWPIKKTFLENKSEIKKPKMPMKLKHYFDVWTMEGLVCRIYVLFNNFLNVFCVCEIHIVNA